MAPTPTPTATCIRTATPDPSFGVPEAKIVPRNTATARLAIARRQTVRRAIQSLVLWAVLALAALDLPLQVKLVYLAAVISGTGLFAWNRLLSRAEKSTAPIERTATVVVQTVRAKLPKTLIARRVDKGA